MHLLEIAIQEIVEMHGKPDHARGSAAFSNGNVMPFTANLRYPTQRYPIDILPPPGGNGHWAGFGIAHIYIHDELGLTDIYKREKKERSRRRREFNATDLFVAERITACRKFMTDQHRNDIAYYHKQMEKLAVPPPQPRPDYPASPIPPDRNPATLNVYWTNQWAEGFTGPEKDCALRRVANKEEATAAATAEFLANHRPLGPYEQVIICDITEWDCWAKVPCDWTSQQINHYATQKGIHPADINVREPDKQKGGTAHEIWLSIVAYIFAARLINNWTETQPDGGIYLLP